MCAFVLYQVFDVSVGLAMFLGSFEALVLVAAIGVAVQDRIHPSVLDQDA